jgi:hypothetical protein
MTPASLFSILLVALGGVLGVMALSRGYRFTLKIGSSFSFDATPPKGNGGNLSCGMPSRGAAHALIGLGSGAARRPNRTALDLLGNKKAGGI